MQKNSDSARCLKRNLMSLGNLPPQQDVQEAAFLVSKAEKIFKDWLGKKKRNGNFWKPYFGGQTMSKCDVKNLKRYIRRILLEIFLNAKLDRQIIENMSDTVFQERIQKIPKPQFKVFAERLSDIKEIVYTLLQRCQNFKNAPVNKKIYMTYELFVIKESLNKTLQTYQSLVKPSQDPMNSMKQFQEVEPNYDFGYNLINIERIESEESSESEMEEKEEKLSKKDYDGNFFNINSSIYEEKFLNQRSFEIHQPTSPIKSGGVIDMQDAIDIAEQY